MHNSYRERYSSRVNFARVLFDTDHLGSSSGASLLHDSFSNLTNRAAYLCPGPNLSPMPRAVDVRVSLGQGEARLGRPDSRLVSRESCVTTNEEGRAIRRAQRDARPVRMSLRSRDTIEPAPSRHLRSGFCEEHWRRVQAWFFINGQTERQVPCRESSCSNTGY